MSRIFQCDICEEQEEVPVHLVQPTDWHVARIGGRVHRQLDFCKTCTNKLGITNDREEGYGEIILAVLRDMVNDSMEP